MAMASLAISVVQAVGPPDERFPGRMGWGGAVLKVHAGHSKEESDRGGGLDLSYRGEHEAPDPESGAPLHDLRGMFPDDLYGPDGLRLYGHNYGEMGAEAVSLIRGLRGRPQAGVKVYRAVPHEPTRDERIAWIVECKRQFQWRYKIPEGAPKPPAGVRYYDHLCNELERLQALPEDSPRERPTIHPGDWVSPVRAYAKEHGEANLNGQFRIISKTVPASTLFTDGDVTEWGYWPEEAWKARPGAGDARVGESAGGGPAGLRAAAGARRRDHG